MVPARDITRRKTVGLFLHLKWKKNNMPHRQNTEQTLKVCKPLLKFPTGPFWWPIGSSWNWITAPVLASFPGARKKFGEECPVSTVHACVAPQVFYGELGNYCDTSLCCITIHYWITGVVTCAHTIIQPSLLVHSSKLCHVPSVRLESQEWHWRMNNCWQYSTSIWQGHVCIATDRYSKYTCISLTVCIRASHSFQKAEAAYHHCGHASYIFTWCNCTLQLYIFLNISAYYYL